MAPIKFPLALGYARPKKEDKFEFKEDDTTKIIVAILNGRFESAYKVVASVLRNDPENKDAAALLSLIVQKFQTEREISDLEVDYEELKNLERSFSPFEKWYVD